MKTIIILRVNGGIGNQFFLYNYYLYLIKRFPKASILFDDSSYYKILSEERSKVSEKMDVYYRLNFFYDIKHINRILSKILYRIGKLNRKYLNLTFLPITLSEHEVRKDESFFSKYKIIHIYGHFIYSNNIPQNIVQLQQIKELKASNSIIEKIQTTESVSIHIRGSFYVKDNTVSQTYAQITHHYYKRAIELVEEKLETPHFFIFTNDMDYAKSFFIGNQSNITFVKGNKDYEDFYLMSKCKHNIIINSTFSHFAAVLNRNENKIVISPEKWSGEKVINEDYDDLPLNNWIKIDNLFIHA